MPIRLGPAVFTNSDHVHFRFDVPEQFLEFEIIAYPTSACLGTRLFASFILTSCNLDQTSVKHPQRKLQLSHELMTFLRSGTYQVAHCPCHLLDLRQRPIAPFQGRIAISRNLHPFSSHAERLQALDIEISVSEDIFADQLLNERLNISPEASRSGTGLTDPHDICPAITELVDDRAHRYRMFLRFLLRELKSPSGHQVTYLLVHVFLDFRRFSLSDLDPTDMERIDNSLYPWYIGSRSSGKSQNSKVGVVSCDIRKDSRISVRSGCLVCLIWDMSA